MSNHTFSRRIIRPATWCLSGKEERTATYLLIGEKRALLIDPGQRRESLRDYVESITDLPFSVFNTSGRAGSTEANSQFSDCEIYMSSDAVAECKKSYQWSRGGIYYGRYSPAVIDDGFALDLGKRRVEVIKAECYSTESLFFLDRTYRILFTGNEIECDTVRLYLNCPKASIESYLDCLRRLNEYRAEYDMICPACGGTPVDATLIDTLMENCQRILSGIQGSACTEENETQKQRLFSSEWKGTFIIYCPDRIHGKNSRPALGGQTDEVL